MSKVPESVQAVMEVLAENPALQGATLEAMETSENVWEITAMAKVCIACARRILTPSGKHTIISHGSGAPGQVTVMPHACGECSRAMAEGVDDAHRTSGGQGN